METQGTAVYTTRQYYQPNQYVEETVQSLDFVEVCKVPFHLKSNFTYDIEFYSMLDLKECFWFDSSNSILLYSSKMQLYLLQFFGKSHTCIKAKINSWILVRTIGNCFFLHYLYSFVTSFPVSVVWFGFLFSDPFSSISLRA